MAAGGGSSSGPLQVAAAVAAARGLLQDAAARIRGPQAEPPPPQCLCAQPGISRPEASSQGGKCFCPSSTAQEAAEPCPHRTRTPTLPAPHAHPAPARA